MLEHLSDAISQKRNGGKRSFVAPLALVAAVAVTTLGPATFVKTQPNDYAAPAIASDEVRTDLHHNPPRTLIAAGRTAMSAYWKGSWRELGKKEHRLPRGTLVTTVKRAERTWYVYHPRRDAYEETEWSWVDVAPGMRKAAVLEGELPSKRLGILDLSTREVTGWVELPGGAASLSWSPDGKHILATGYDRHPDEVEFVNDHTRFGTAKPSARTGFHVVDAATLQARFNPVPAGPERAGRERNDFRWVSPATVTSEVRHLTESAVYYGLNGEVRSLSAGELDPPESRAGRAGISPDGKLLAGPAGMPTRVVERSTGREAGTQQVLDLISWADDDRLVALGCHGDCDNEFRNALVLVGVDGTEITRLSAFRASDEDWHPVFTER